MNEQKFPPGWDADRVERLLAHYDTITEEEQVAEDEEAASETAGQVVITLPEELLPEVRRLLATQRSA